MRWTAALALLVACRSGADEDAKAADRPAPEARAAAPAPLATPAPAAPAPVLPAAPGLVAFVAEADGGRKAVHLVAPDGGGERALAGPAADLYPVGRGGGGLVAIGVSDREGEHRESLVVLPLAADGAWRSLFTSARTTNPVVSADGAVAVVESDQQGFRDLFAVTLADGEVRRLTTDPKGSFEPSLSPDGARVAFASSRTGDAEIFVQPLAGGAATRLTTFHRDDWAPAFSPTGELVAFVSSREGKDRVFVVAPDGRGTRRLGAAWDADGEAEPVWSPDGANVALVAGTGGGDVGLYLVEVATGARRRLSPKGVRPTQASFSPDGRQIVYVDVEGDGARLRRVAVDGSGDVAIPTRTKAWRPRWLAP
jgi:dipeptidyl aminopeptidase/acylaminoacyl peptidase